METVLLVGFPNSGKSTIFNSLTGQMKKVGNYSGITVSDSTAELLSNKDFERKIQLVDLPGVYNLSPSAKDEAITVSRILSEDNKYNLVAVILDAERLEASLSLALALKEFIAERVVLILNKDDNNFFKGEQRKELEKKIGLKIISTSAKYHGAREVDRFLRDFSSIDPISLENTLSISEKSIEHFLDTPKKNLEVISTDKIQQKIIGYQQQAREILSDVQKEKNKNFSMTKKIDSFIIHPFFGGLVFLAVFYFIFLAIYSWSGPLMDLIDESIGGLGEMVATFLPKGLISSLIVDGIIAGVGGVIIFLPQIMILFFLFSLLEQSGYIARAAIVTDKVMGIFGLNGKAFLPYLSGLACSIPGIMATRTIPDKKERIATMMTIPMITCSARLPVYVLLIGTFIPATQVFGIFDTQALSFFFLYFLGGFFALVIAKIFRLSFFKGKSSSFFIELPTYQIPSLKLALLQSWQKGLLFLKKAGTIILSLSIIIWAASTFPGPSESEVQGKSEAEVAALTLEGSILGSVGKAIEPIIEPIGMDWKMGVGLLVAFGARELFVSTLGTIYALGDVDEESKSLRDRLKNEVHPVTGKPVFNFAVAWSILIFFVFAMQCLSTLAILKRETGGWKMPIYATIYMGGLAYVGSFIAYTILS